MIRDLDNYLSWYLSSDLTPTLKNTLVTILLLCDDQKSLVITRDDLQFYLNLSHIQVLRNLIKLEFKGYIRIKFNIYNNRYQPNNYHVLV